MHKSHIIHQHTVCHHTRVTSYTSIQSATHNSYTPAYSFPCKTATSYTSIQFPHAQESHHTPAYSLPSHKSHIIHQHTVCHTQQLYTSIQLPMQNSHIIHQHTVSPCTRVTSYTSIQSAITQESHHTPAYSLPSHNSHIIQQHTVCHTQQSQHTVCHHTIVTSYTSIQSATQKSHIIHQHTVCHHTIITSIKQKASQVPELLSQSTDSINRMFYKVCGNLKWFSPVKSQCTLSQCQHTPPTSALKEL